MKNLLVATDYSEIARHAYVAAASIAKKYDAAIQLVHEVESVPVLYYEAVNSRELLDSYYGQLMVKLEEEVHHPAFQGLRVSPRLVGRALERERLVDFVETQITDLIVLSTHGRSGLSHTLLGSFAEHVARRSPVPVLTYRKKESEREQFAPRSLLVPFDFSENAKSIFPLVRSLAERFESKIRFLHVLPEVSVRGDWENVQERLRVTDETASALEDQLESMSRTELPGLNVVADTRYGDPYREIIKESNSVSADVIAMTTHGWTGLKRMYFGSVAEKVIRTAPCSVLTFRPRQLREGTIDDG